MDFKSELEQVGEWFKEAVEATIDSSMPPPNSPSTIRQKGHGRTLIDSGKLRKSIAVQVNSDSVEVGVFDPKVAEYARLVHDGTRTIPARPFIAKTVDERGDEILDKFEDAIFAKIDEFMK